MEIVVVRHPAGETELALMTGTVPVPTVALVDSQGEEFMVEAHRVAPATPAEAKRYWTERHRHLLEWWTVREHRN